MNTSPSRVAEKFAVDLPADVERYVQEGLDQGLPESEAWAVAWSRYCKYKAPGDPHCRMKAEEYFKAASKRVVSRYVTALEAGQAGPGAVFLEIDLRDAPF